MLWAVGRFAGSIVFSIKILGLAPRLYAVARFASLGRVVARFASLGRAVARFASLGRAVARFASLGELARFASLGLTSRQTDTARDA